MNFKNYIMANRADLIIQSLSDSFSESSREVNSSYKILGSLYMFRSGIIVNRESLIILSSDKFRRRLSTKIAGIFTHLPKPKPGMDRTDMVSLLLASKAYSVNPVSFSCPGWVMAKFQSIWSSISLISKSDLTFELLNKFIDGRDHISFAKSMNVQQDRLHIDQIEDEFKIKIDSSLLSNKVINIDKANILTSYVSIVDVYQSLIISNYT